MIDLMSALQGAVFERLESQIDSSLGKVRDIVLQDEEPPLIVVGNIDSGNEAGKGEQLERLTIEVQSIYRGEDRSRLLAMMHAVREALDGAQLAADGVHFARAHFIDASASSSARDGVTYAGISNFEVLAEPA